MAQKKIKGRKRHIVVDVEGNLLTVKVHAGNQHDTKSGSAVLEQTLKKYPTIQAFSADAGYRKSCENFCNQELNRPLHISVRIKDEFAIMPKRWIVERTFAWLGNFRRLCKDFEKLITHAQDMIRIAMIRLGLNRLLSLFYQTAFYFVSRHSNHISTLQSLNVKRNILCY